MSDGGKLNSWAAPVRLAPDIASFRLLVLAFVREYITLLGHSPSLGEIANRLQSNRTRVRKAIRSLVDDGLLLRTPGPRGLTLPTMRDEAVRQLRALGWTVDEDVGRAHCPVTKGTLQLEPVLDYLPAERTGAGHDEFGHDHRGE